MNSRQVISALESLAGDPHQGLPEDLFLQISRLTPLINVDLLVKDQSHRTLLAWREDEYYGAGWHLPGGIVRFQETTAHRVIEVAREELGAEVSFDAKPIAVEELIDRERRTRGHSVSLLYRCTLLSPPDQALRFTAGAPEPRQWKWHSACPPNLLRAHRMYEPYLGRQDPRDADPAQQE